MLNIDYRNYQLLFCDFKVFVLEALNNLVINIWPYSSHMKWNTAVPFCNAKSFTIGLLFRSWYALVSFPGLPWYSGVSFPVW